ncbi:MAG: hypothetical protein AMJ78_00035 [Omnitrophica WOR_2 bacterium SM23_29]|nr:MAG: hypothetical protein AMJ78_00035 [Omnitrophica WOR_2 bacterium SM23_29]
MIQIKPKIPDEIVDKWQKKVDLICAVMDVPAGLIMKICQLQVEVLVASTTTDNPYRSGQKFNLEIGQYCEAVMAQRAKLLIPDARKDPQWTHSPDIALGMISYLGLPLAWPDAEMFGIICVLDKKENHFSLIYQNLILQFKNAIESDLNLLLKITEHERAKEALLKLKEELEIKVEERTNELRKTNEQLQAEVFERRKAEEALRESEERWRLLAQNIPDIILTVDREGKILAINRTVSGITIEETIGKSVYDYIACEHFNTLSKTLERVFQTGEPDTYGVLGTGANGPNTAWYETRVVPIKRNEQVIAVTLISTDITERKKSEEALKTERDKLGALMEGLTRTEIGIDIIGLDYKIVFQNKTLKERFGDLTGKLCYESYMGSKKPCDYCPMLEAIKNNKVESVELTGADGRNYVLFSAPLPNPVGSVDKAIEVVLDITERKKSEKTLRESEEKFRLAFENATDAILWADPNSGMIINCNRAAEVLLERKKEEIIGSHQTMLHPSQKAKYYSDMFRKHVAQKKVFNDEAEIITKSGKIKPVHITAAVTILEERPILQGIFRDISERKMAEGELIQAQKLASIGQLAAGVAHEINNPLSAISGEIQYLLERNKDKKLTKSLQFMNRVSNRIAHIINNLLIFSREASTKTRESSNINSLIEKSLLLFERRLNASKIKVIKKLGKNLPDLTVNRGEIEQVIINILLNSLDAMPHGGELSIYTRLSSDKEAEEIIFTDTGPGIAKENLTKVFDPFFSTKAPGKGAGLGLYLSHGIIKKHNGDIILSSELGKGARILIRLPLE